MTCWCGRSAAAHRSDWHRALAWLALDAAGLALLVTLAVLWPR